MSLLQFRKLFGHEAAEDENPDRLSEYFVVSRDFEDFDDPNELFLIVKGKKGIGKSAVLSYFSQKLSNNSKLTLNARGATLSNYFKPKEYDPNSLVNEWQKAICSFVSCQIGNKIGFAFSEDEISLVEHAEVEGFKQKNIIKTIFDRFSIKLGGLEVKNSVSSEYTNLLTRYMNKNCDDSVWLFIDDIDQTFQNDTNNRYKISTFFTACRYLSKDIPSLKIRASIRDDVWWSISREDEALDKVPQYIREIKWDSKDTVRIIGKRIDVFAKHSLNARKYYTPKSNEKPYYEIFPRSYKWRKETVPSHVFFHMLAMGRPRWAIQLGRECIQIARSRKTTPKKIYIDLLLRALPNYSNIKSNDIIAEYDHECQRLREIIFSFYGMNSMWSTHSIEQFINSLLVGKHQIIISDNDSPNAIEIAHFLYKIGFINAFIPETKTLKTEYFRYEEKPHLLSMEINKDKDFHWSIHPCFHPVLHLAVGYNKNKNPSSRKPLSEIPV